MAWFEVGDSRTVRDACGHESDLLEAIAGLTSMRQLCPQMPHEYAVPSKPDQLQYAVVVSRGSQS